MKMSRPFLTGPALAFARRRVGLSAHGLARALRMSPRELRAWEARHEPIPAAALEAIADALRAARLRQAADELTRRAALVKVR